jgi:hypothetical protein
MTGAAEQLILKQISSPTASGTVRFGTGLCGITFKRLLTHC